MNIRVFPSSELELKRSSLAIIRRLGEAWPNTLQAWGETYANQADQAGVRVLRQIVGNEIHTAYVLSVDAEAQTRAWQFSLNKLYTQLAADKISELALIFLGKYSQAELVQAVKYLQLADYRFDRFKSSGLSRNLQAQANENFRAGNWDFYLPTEVPDAIAFEAQLLAESINEARDLVNLPANHLTPIKLAERAQELAARDGFEAEIYGPEAIREKGLAAYWAVAKGSSEEPRLMVLRYHNAPESERILALVGKGLCYDSGGYAIKGAEGMATMHCDMGGAAAVLAAISALARAHAKVNVTVLIAACENMISGHAYRNGDIISSLAGKSIEVVNTDAEGRLTLADAVCYAWKEEKAAAIIDIATLTGAVGTALGLHSTGILADCDELYALAEKASSRSGDKIWRLPIDDEYEAQNKSEHADIRNSGGRSAGCITAGLFVRAFAGEKPFMHLDIAGTAFHAETDGRDPKGATGAGCELLYHIAQGYFA